MRTGCRIWTCMVLVLLAGLAGFANDAGLTVHRDIEYAAPGGTPLLLDLFLPSEDAAAPLPVVLSVHGGGWRAGSKDKDYAAIAIARRGFAVARINYRLSQVATFPAQIEDCKAAVRWLRANADAYHLDPDHIGAFGISAGGHLVALLGTTGDGNEFEGTAVPGYSTRVQAVCVLAGPTDLSQTDAEGKSVFIPGVQGMIHDLLGETTVMSPQADAASPITYVTPDDAPCLLLHSDVDPLVPLSQCDAFHTALRAADVPSTRHVEVGAKHTFWSPDIETMVADFFTRHLTSPARDVSGD